MCTKVVEKNGEALAQFTIGFGLLREQDAQAASAANDAIELLVRMITVHKSTTVLVRTYARAEHALFACYQSGV